MRAKLLLLRQALVRWGQRLNLANAGILLGVGLTLGMLAQFASGGAYIQEISVWVQRGQMALVNTQVVAPSLNSMMNAKDRNGVTLWGAIHQIASGAVAVELAAIAIHEGRGQFGAAESGGKGPGKCAFQITGSTVDAAAKMMGVTAAYLKQNIMFDAKLCAAAGYVVLMEKARISGSLGYTGGNDPSGPGAVCLYGGQIKTDSGATITYYKGDGQGKTFFTWQKCPAYIEVQAIKSFLNGEGASSGTGNTDIHSVLYSTITIKDGKGNEIGVELTCIDYSESLARGMAQAKKGLGAAQAAMFQKTYSDGIDSDNAHQMDPPHGKLKDRECLKLVTSDYFDSIIKAIKSLSSDKLMDFIFDQLDKLVDSLIQTACVWVAQQVNNLLSQVCLPLHDMTFGFSLPSLEAKSCSGVSLADMFKITSDYGAGGVGNVSVSVLPYPRPFIGPSMDPPAETALPYGRKTPSAGAANGGDKAGALLPEGDGDGITSSTTSDLVY